MGKSIPVTTLSLDIGGVLLSNGWGHESRKSAAEFFTLNYNEMQDLHELTMVTYEEGKLTLIEYLNRIVFYPARYKIFHNSMSQIWDILNSSFYDIF